jgi:pimeloyl-ACP methyl ester carboxylesterase
MNGLGSQLEVLEPLVDQLPPDLEVIRFDVPGVGGSPAPLLPYHYATLASLVGALVRSLGHEQVDVLGFSWGGGLAQQFAVTQARKCRRLVLASTGTGAVMVPARPGVLGHMLHPRRHRDPAYTRRIASSSTAARCAPTPSARRRCCTPTPARSPPAATSTNCWHRRLDEPARPCPHPAADARAVRDDDPLIPPSTPGSSPAASPTRACTSIGAATSPSSPKQRCSHR